MVGPHSGQRLGVLPSVTMAWGEWKSIHPDTQLLVGRSVAPSQFAAGRYGRELFAGYAERVNDNQFAFPVDEEKLDERLDSGAVVLTSEVDGHAVAYPIDLLGDAAVNDQVGALPVVVFSREKNLAAGAFSRAVNGQTLTFNFDKNSGVFIDLETSTHWNADGRGISGELAGTQLKRLESRRGFWFSVAIALPEVRLYKP